MAGLIPQYFIDDLLTRIDIVDVIDGYVPLKRAGRNHMACCPFHNEKTPSFTVSQEKQFFHCFGCGANGSAIGFLMEHAGMTFPEAIEDLASRAGVEVVYEGGGTAARPAEDKSDLYELMELAVRYYSRQLREHPQREQAVAYLKKRGLTGEIASEFEIGFAPPGWDNLLGSLGKSPEAIKRLASIGLLVEKDGAKGHYDRFRERVMFPIRDRRGRAIGFGGRVLGDGEPKYLN
ncbi:MAG: CHC2 zinc finger domain-containing protein, partial [Haliea sp.]